MYDTEIQVILGLRDVDAEGWALCVDSHGHGLWIQWKTLHEMIEDIPAYTPDRAYVGDSLEAFVMALALHTQTHH